MSDELKPCPFCGDNESHIVMWVDWGYRVVCLPPPPPEFSEDDDPGWTQNGCGAYGARFAREKDAIAAWNRRTPEPGKDGNNG